VDDAAVSNEYFVIPVKRLLDDPNVKGMVHWNFPPPTVWTHLGFVLNHQKLGGMLGQWNTADYPLVDQDYLDHTFTNLTELTPHAEAAYKEWGAQHARGESPQILTYMGLPHVFVLGEIDIDGLETIRVE